MNRMTTIQKTQMTITMVACLIVLVVILQNTGAVETRLLFITVSMPMALLLIITFVAGFFSGTLLVGGFLKKPDKKNVEDKA